jgi:cytochrome d ubiquinol oxidase subunit I
MGRQPFVVAPNPTGVDGVYLFTAAAVSPGVTAGELITSLVSFAAIYGVLLVVEVYLLVRTIRGGVAAVVPELDPPAAGDREDDVLAFAY